MTFIVISMLLLAFTLIPILFMVTTSLKSPMEIRTAGTLLPGAELYWENWTRAYRNVPVHIYLLNSTLTAIFSAALAIVLALPVSYVIARFNFGGSLLPSWILGTYVTPPIVIAIPVFMLFRQIDSLPLIKDTIGWIDTVHGLALVHAVGSLPVAVWMLESFIHKVPHELDESAWLDGASRLRTVWSIIVPVILPGIIATFIICMILSWNEFLFALILTYSDASQTFPIGISNFIGEHGQQFGEMSAAALGGLVPIFVLALIFQRYLVEGLSEGSVKS
ncbi:MAG: carbohydrate ABC transporter permease [Chloroflexota bacterium]|nr:carbohydrate ABC transporter permease [Chloroflexota bacterium]